MPGLLAVFYLAGLFPSERKGMASVLLTKRVEFAAAHHYQYAAWGAVRNRAVFGSGYSESGHGHNYLLEVTVTGEVDDVTGMVINLTDLKRVLKQVLEEFDHKHLNLDTPYFAGINPTVENLAWILWRLLEARPAIGRLHKIRIYQDEDLYAEVSRDLLPVLPGVTEQPAWLTRRYYFSAAHRLHSPRLSETENRRLYGSCSGLHSHGHNYVLTVTVFNAIDHVTGMAVDLQALDGLVQQTVLQRFDHQDLNRDPAFQTSAPTGENFVRLLWMVLVEAIPAGRLERIGLKETHESSYEYTR